MRSKIESYQVNLVRETDANSIAVAEFCFKIKLRILEYNDSKTNVLHRNIIKQSIP